MAGRWMLQCSDRVCNNRRTTECHFMLLNNLKLPWFYNGQSGWLERVAKLIHTAHSTGSLIQLIAHHQWKPPQPQTTDAILKLPQNVQPSAEEQTWKVGECGSQPIRLTVCKGCLWKRWFFSSLMVIRELIMVDWLLVVSGILMNAIEACDVTDLLDVYRSAMHGLAATPICLDLWQPHLACMCIVAIVADLSSLPCPLSASLLLNGQAKSVRQSLLYC